MEPAPASPDPSSQDHSPVPSPAKRSAWKHPSSNGFVDAPPPGVIDANHWPALSEAAKTKPALPSDSSKPPDPSPAPAAVASPAIANPSNSLKHGSGTHHARQKPARRGGGGDHSPRDHPERGTGGWDHGSGGGGRGGQRSHNNGGGGGRRGSGSGGGVAHHGGFGGRRRGGFEGFYRGPPMGIGPYMRGAPPPPPPLAVAPPFMGPPPPPVSHMRAFAGPMLFHEMPSPLSPVSPMYYVGPPPPPEALRGLAFAPPMVGPPAYPYFQPPAEPEPDADDRHGELLRQIEFYFSKDNLCADVFLRRNMDEQGWVDISLIAGFKKVQEITKNLQYIKETIQSSSILELQGDKIRRQKDWNKWVIPRESNPGIPSSSAAVPSANVNNLTAQLGGMGLHESASSSSMVDQNHHEVLLNGSTSSNSQSPAIEDDAGHR